MIVKPGSTIGIVGGGQLGRMLSIAAARLGYRCHILAPDEAPCAAEVAARHVRAAYDDADALADFAAACDIVTYEFENLPADALAPVGGKLLPGIRSLTVAQDRATEKAFIENCGGRVAAWRAVDASADVAKAIGELGLPFVLKSRRLGYDGKGQAWVRSERQADEGWATIGRQPAIAEAAVAFHAEFSVLLARGADGTTAVWDVPENRHDDGILRRSTVPAGEAVAAQAGEAVRQAKAVAEALDHVGVLTVEFFAGDGGPLVNEIAPRVHNSGHWTIEGAATSQFEQHIRAICGLPLGFTVRTAPTVTMDNLIGDDVRAWRDLAAEPGARLHLYGKGDPRPGRKMGHVTRLSHQA